MSTQAVNGSPTDLDEVLALASRLTPVQKVRLVEQLMTTLERELESLEPNSQPLQTWRGLCADLGRAPSLEVIDEMRSEIWADFPRADLP